MCIIYFCFVVVIVGFVYASTTLTTTNSAPFVMHMRQTFMRHWVAKRESLPIQAGLLQGDLCRNGGGTGPIWTVACNGGATAVRRNLPPASPPMPCGGLPLQYSEIWSQYIYIYIYIPFRALLAIVTAAAAGHTLPALPHRSGRSHASLVVEVRIMARPFGLVLSYTPRKRGRMGVPRHVPTKGPRVRPKE